MKILDDKGRLFGKINVIDFFVLVFFLYLTPMFYYGYKLFNRPPPPSPPLTIKTYEQQYNELVASKVAQDKEKEYEQKFMQLERNIDTKDIDLGDLLKGYRMILLPDEKK